MDIGYSGMRCHEERSMRLLAMPHSYVGWIKLSGSTNARSAKRNHIIAPTVVAIGGNHQSAL
jgi:hypothetical protein